MPTFPVDGLYMPVPVSPVNVIEGAAKVPALCDTLVENVAVVSVNENRVKRGFVALPDVLVDKLIVALYAPLSTKMMAAGGALGYTLYVCPRI